MTDTNELRKLLAAATPLPWIVQKDDCLGSWSVTGTANDPVPGWGRTEPEAFDDGSAHGEYGPSCKEPTRDLIVAAVNGLPAMLDELDAARADVEQMRAAMREALSRADPREALSLLRNIDWDKDNWDDRYKALLAKHKETP